MTIKEAYAAVDAALEQVNPRWGGTPGSVGGAGRTLVPRNNVFDYKVINAGSFRSLYLAAIRTALGDFAGVDLGGES